MSKPEDIPDWAWEKALSIPVYPIVEDADHAYLTRDDFTAIARAIAEAVAEERERGEIKSAQAYQVIGNLLMECGKFDSDEGQRALDYFSSDEVDEDFLPWPAVAEVADPTA